MLTKYKILGILAIVGGLVYGTWATVEYIYSSGFTSGVSAADLKNSKALKEQSISYKQEVDRLKSTVSLLEDQISKSVSEIDTDYINTLEKQNDELQDTLNAINSGSIRLYDNGTLPTTSDTTEATGDSTTPASCGNNDTEGVKLSKETSRYLVQSASRADEYTGQLTACQNLVKTYLEVINQYNQSLQ